MDLAGRFAAFILAAGLRLAVVVAMLSPLLTQANHLQAERITAESAVQVLVSVKGGYRTPEAAISPAAEEFGCS